MGRVRNTSAAHRPGPLKQANKKHKTGRHRSKGVIDVETRGRVSSIGSISKKKKGALSRADRRRQAAANRDQKIQTSLEQKRLVGGHRGAPLFVSIIPLSNCSNAPLTLKHIVQTLKDDIKIVGNELDRTIHLTLKSGKKVTLCIPAANDLWSLLDTMKMSDVTLFHMPVLEPISEEGRTLLKAAKDQGLNTPFVGATTPFSKQDEKMFLKNISKLFVPVNKVFSLQTSSGLLNVLRIMTSTKLHIPKNWSTRSAMLIENSQSISLEPDVVSKVLPALGGLQQQQPLKGLQVTGFIRRQNLNPHSPVHIPGVGDFKIMRIDAMPPENNSSSQFTLPLPELAPWFLYDPQNEIKDDVDDQASNADSDDMMSDSEMEDEALEDFFGKPGKSSSNGTSIVGQITSSSAMDCDQMSQDGDETSTTKKKRQVPKGTSSYQADWLLEDSEDSDKEGSNLINSDDEIESENESQDGGDDDDDEEDEGMDWAEEQEKFKLAKAARMEAEFPDWIDTPIETPAKVRFQRYRGLQSFKKSTWDPNENLPREYSKIFQFQNFRQTYKKILAQDPDGTGYIPIGHRVSILLTPIGEAASYHLNIINTTKPLALFSHFKHESKMSVLNIQLNITDVIKNKEELIFQVGYRRFLAKPILSEISTGNKHKMLRFAQANSSCMATIIAPIVFPNASVLVFKKDKSSLIPLGNGHIFSVDPNRIVVKRVLLSGAPFRSHGRKAVVRFMFFSRADIEWFKPVELKTRYGLRGHIKEPLGTHGRMKCIFDGPIKSQDTVLMPLYKRVFPKINYEPTVLPYNVYDSYELKPSALPQMF